MGRPGRTRRQAEDALRFLAGAGHEDAVCDGATEYGSEAAAAVETLLGADPLVMPPGHIPKLPYWARPSVLPSVLMREGSVVLPESAVRHALTALALCRPGEPYAALPAIRAAYDPASLAGFGWELLQSWLLAGAPAADGWPLTVLGLIGDDDTARRLTPAILSWPGDGGHVRAAVGVEVLAALGRPATVIQLNTVVQRTKFRPLRKAAAEKLQDVADRLKITAEQLAGRLVPDFGIAADVHERTVTLAESLAQWQDLFLDYEIVQPFPQLGRETWQCFGNTAFISH
ncbi:DUF4132 domain-containing protein [Winogradskya humida]|uniref:DUF4132 domain-containing protein n=1 Tax=Winogradskya humida TaxID=113566 RepID=UPI001941E182|nr:DUF4132 domain-containing protein [Actinoplanes humidus]